MLERLAQFGRSRRYWALLAIMGLAFEAVALYFQYVREEYPCVMCIHVRLWFAALVILALVMLLLPRLRAVVAAGHALTLLVAAGLLERSWQLLGVERGFIISECGFDLGLPAWFRPDDWLPSVFRVENTCGYTPELLFGVTMAEALLVFSALFLLLGLAMLFAAMTAMRPNTRR